MPFMITVAICVYPVVCRIVKCGILDKDLRYIIFFIVLSMLAYA